MAYGWVIITVVILNGAEQTVPRTELRAVCSAVKKIRRPSLIYSDCKWVVRGVRRTQEGLSNLHLEHIDLWMYLDEVWNLLPNRGVGRDQTR